MSRPRLSFIVPVYKPHMDIFERHLKSLKDQALKSWEAIFVLDGSFPAAFKLINTIFAGDDRIMVIQKEHEGVQVARNTGGERATGEFLCFFDCDNIIEPGTSAMWVDQLDRHPEAAFVYSGYKFLGDKFAFDSQAWDYWALKIRNFVGCSFPLRKELYPGWTVGLKSLQDWDMWLSLCEKAVQLGYDESKLGLFVRGYAFSTLLPEPGSISGEGCKPEVWLERMDAVKSRHNLTDKSVCVSSFLYPQEGTNLAKLIDADFLAYPDAKPNKYKTIIQLGFSLGRNVEKHASIFQQKGTKNILFWKSANINEIWNGVCLKQIDAMSQLLNKVSTQYCEDKEAQRLLKRAGFEAAILPLPLGAAKPLPLPEKPKWLIDITGDYSHAFCVIEKSLPDIELNIMDGYADLTDFTGLIHFYPDRTMTSEIKRAHMTGRHVISNVQAPYCGYVNATGDVEDFIIGMVDKIRELTQAKVDADALKFYESGKETIMAAIA